MQVLVQNVLPRNVHPQKVLPHNVLLYKTSFLQNVHRYKTSMDTKRPPLLYVQPTKCPQKQNVHGYKMSFLYKTSIHTESPSLLQGLCLFSQIYVRSVSSTKSRWTHLMFLMSNSLLVNYYYPTCDELLSLATYC